MYTYIHKITKQYPVSEAEIKEQNPSICFPVPFVPPETYSYVFPTPKPDHDPVIQTAVETAPIDLGSRYEQRWEIRSLYTSVQEAAVLAQYLETQKTAKKSAVSSQRDIEEAAGFSYSFPDGHIGTVQTGPDDIKNILGLVTSSLVLKDRGILDSQIPFRDLENVIHLLSPDQIMDLGMSASAYVSGTYITAWSKKAQIDSATTLQELNEIEL